jgi:hypothetical protein
MPTGLRAHPPPGPPPLRRRRAPDEDIVIVWGSQSGTGSQCMRVWFRVGCVCWRHTIRPDGAWVWRMLAADKNVRTLSGARCRAPSMGKGFFCNRWLVLIVRSNEEGTCLDFKVGGARAVGRGFSKL